MSDPVDIHDPRHYARWLLRYSHAHAPVSAPEGPYSCEYCPWGAKTREPYHEISNDVSEAHYICPVLGKDVWGESPQCAGHQDGLLTAILKSAADWDVYEKEMAEAAARERAAHAQQEAFRRQGLAKLTDQEVHALGLKR